MSQHTLLTTTSTGTQVEVFCGWDAPLQRYFLDIIKVDHNLPDDQDEEYLYSAMRDHPKWSIGPPYLMEDLVAALKQFEVVYPEKLITHLSDEYRAPRDGENSRLKRVWSVDGRWM